MCFRYLRSSWEGKSMTLHSSLQIFYDFSILILGFRTIVLIHLGFIVLILWYLEVFAKLKMKKIVGNFGLLQLIWPSVSNTVLFRSLRLPLNSIACIRDTMITNTTLKYRAILNLIIMFTKTSKFHYPPQFIMCISIRLNLYSSKRSLIIS